MGSVVENTKTTWSVVGPECVPLAHKHLVDLIWVVFDGLAEVSAASVLFHIVTRGLQIKLVLALLQFVLQRDA